jgi:hypothetical protein
MKSDVIDKLLAAMAIDEFMEFMRQLFPDLIDDLAMQSMKQAWIDLEDAEAYHAVTAATHYFDWQANPIDDLGSTALLHWLITTKYPFTSKTGDQLSFHGLNAISPNHEISSQN